MNFGAQGDGQRRSLFGLSLPGGSVVSMYLIKKVKLPLIGRRNFEPWGIILAYKFQDSFSCNGAQNIFKYTVNISVMQVSLFWLL